MSADLNSTSPFQGKQRPGPPEGIVRIIVLYATFSVLWIQLSDKVVEWMFDDPTWISIVSTCKGWLYVAVTSLLLFRYMRRLPGHSPTAQPFRPPASRLRWFLPLPLVVLAIVTLMAGTIVQLFTTSKTKEVALLKTITDLKSRQIADWLRERESDAQFIRTSRIYAELYRRWRMDGDEESGGVIRRRLSEYRAENRLGSVLIFNEHENLLWDSTGTGTPIDPPLARAVAQATTEGTLTRAIPYRDSSGTPHLDLVAPLVTIGSPPFPAFVLRLDPMRTLFPAIQAWPVPGRSGMTLLFRKDGDEVQFLNQPYHAAGPPAPLRVPLSDGKCLAAKVLRSETRFGSLLEGVDHKGVSVTGVARAVPGTDWVLLTTIERSEMYSEATRNTLWITLSALLALFMASVALLSFRRRQELDFSLREQQVQAEKLRALQMVDAITESSADAIFAKDLDGRYLLFNREACRVTGKSAEEVIGRDDMTIFPPDQAARIMANDRKAVEENRIITIEERLSTATGEITYLSVKGPLRDTEGNVIGMFGISRDVTARVKAEEALRASEEKFRLAFHTSPDAININRISDGLYLDVNAGFSRILGLTREEVIGKTSLELNIWANSNDRSRMVDALLNQGYVDELEAPFRARDGRIITGLMSARAFQINGEDVLLSITRDITERKRAEEALRKSEELYRTLVSLSPDAISMVDLNGILTFASPTALEIFGHSPEDEVVGRDVLTWVAPEDKDKAARNNEHLISHGSYIDHEFALLRKDGSGFIGEVNGAVIHALDGSPAGIVMVTRDITERKRAEEEKVRLEAQLLEAQKMEAVGTLAGGIAHDFNNILAPIIGYTEIALAKMPEPSSTNQGLQMVLAAAYRARDLVKQILALSRRGQGPQMTTLDLSPVVKEALQLLRASLPASVEIVQDVDEGIAVADAAQVHQIVVNLCTNAAHAMEGRGILDVSLKKVFLKGSELNAPGFPDLAPGAYLRLRVSDTGQGMDEATVQRIFEPYFTTKAVGKGTGLGLAVVHGIIKRHGGDVVVRSTPGMGSTFDVFLPCADASPAETSAETEPTPTGTERILVVDDEQPVADLTFRMLNALGYRITVMTNPVQALERFRSQPGAFDLVITDYTMPVMSGLELVRKMRDARRDIPVILCTGYNEGITEGILREMDISSFLLKPFGRNLMANAVRRALDESRTRRAVPLSV